MVRLHQFIRSVSPHDLRHHMEQCGISLPSRLDWEVPEDEFSEGFLKAVDDLTEQERTQLLADIDRISDMTDEVGQAALMALADWRDRSASSTARIGVRIGFTSSLSNRFAKPKRSATRTRTRMRSDYGTGSSVPAWSSSGPTPKSSSSSRQR